MSASRWALPSLVKDLTDEGEVSAGLTGRLVHLPLARSVLQIAFVSAEQIGTSETMHGAQYAPETIDEPALHANHFVSALRANGDVLDWSPIPERMSHISARQFVEGGERA